MTYKFLRDPLLPAKNQGLSWPLAIREGRPTLCGGCGEVPFSPFLHCEEEKVYCHLCVEKLDLYGEVVILFPKPSRTRKLNSPPLQGPKRFGPYGLSVPRQPIPSSLMVPIKKLPSPVTVVNGKIVTAPAPSPPSSRRFIEIVRQRYRNTQVRCPCGWRGSVQDMQQQHKCGFAEVSNSLCAAVQARAFYKGKRNKKEVPHDPMGCLVMAHPADPMSHMYCGTVSKGRISGEGKWYLVHADGRRTLLYSGAWKNGFPHGRGTQWFRNGTRRAGRFAEGCIEKGTEYRADGSVRYEGQFDRKGRYHGPKGVEFFEAGGRAYEGPHVRGQRAGKGCVLYHASPPNVSRFRGEIHPGDICWNGFEFDKQGDRTKRWTNGLMTCL